MLTPDHAHVLAGQGLAGQLQALLLGPAGPAPGRPEVEHQGVAAQAGQVDPLVVEGPAGEGGQGLALALGHHGDARGDLLHLPGAGLGGQARPAGAGQGDHGDHGRRHDHGHHGNGGAARHGDLGLLDSWDPGFECSRRVTECNARMRGRGTIGSLDVEATGVSLVRPKDEGERWIKLTLVTMGIWVALFVTMAVIPSYWLYFADGTLKWTGTLHHPLRLRRAGPAPCRRSATSSWSIWYGLALGVFGLGISLYNKRNPRTLPSGEEKREATGGYK